MSHLTDVYFPLPAQARGIGMSSAEKRKKFTENFSRTTLEIEEIDGLIAHNKLLDLPGDGHG